MFSTSAKKTIALATTCFALLAIDSQNVDAQAQRIQRAPAYRTAQVPVDYDMPPAPSRMSQVQNARMRAQNVVRSRNMPQQNTRTMTRPRSQGVRVAQNTNTRVAQRSIENAPVGAVVQGQAARQQGTRIVGGPTPNAGNYMPKHLRTAQLIGDPIVGGGAPIMGGTPVMSGSVIGAPMMDGGVVNGPISGMVDGGVVNYGTPMGGQVISGGEIISGGGCADGCCASGGACGDGGCGVGVGDDYFNCDPCAYSNGGCPPESLENCWLWGLGSILKRGELFLGATAFRSPGYNVTDAAGGVTGINDCSFGFYGGVNYGIPLCRLTCGFLSGQLGIRSVQTEFDENQLTSDNRDQLFITAGLYRRVDYGLQAGVVADFLKEEWFGSASIAQVRGEVSWVYGPSALGFRFTQGQESDFTSGTLGGNNFSNVLTESLDQYRFYYRSNIAQGGYCDLYAGWSDDDHTIFGVEADVPMSSIWALQTGFTYLDPDQDLAGQNDDAWNVYMGIAIRPRGRHFYGNYDRPLFSVADNGSMVVRRTSN